MGNFLFCTMFLTYQKMKDLPRARLFLNNIIEYGFTSKLWKLPSGQLGNDVIVYSTNFSATQMNTIGLMILFQYKFQRFFSSTDENNWFYDSISL